MKVGRLKGTSFTLPPPSLRASGETDWKVLVIDVKDPLAEKLNGTYCFVVASSAELYVSG